MKPFFAPFLLGLAVIPVSALATPAYKILSVTDGDTLKLTSESGTKVVRLACIDAPEKNQAPYGENARNALIRLAPTGAPVGIRHMSQDVYGRTVAEVFLGDKNVNLQMVQSGNAFAYTAYMKGCDKESYGVAQRAAIAKRLGIWVTPDGITRPWDWRHKPTGKNQLTCKSLTRGEALELYNGGHIYLDKNNDGIPCNGNN